MKRHVFRQIALTLAPILLLAAPVAIVAEIRGMSPIDRGGGTSAAPLPTPTPTPTPPGAAAETFYVRASGTGAAPETVAGGWDEAAFNTAGNWTISADVDDGKIGPGDTVIIMTNDGDLSGLTIQGSGTEGSPITIKRRNEASTPTVDGAAATANALVISGKSWLVIDGIAFENGSGGTSGVILITGAGSDNIIIQNCTIGPSTQHGILFAASAGANITIDDNTISGNTKDGISAAAHIGSTSLATQTEITNNTITGNGQNSILAYSNFWKIDHNIISANGGAGVFAGIHIYGGATDDGTGDNNLVTYNSVTGQTGNGEGGAGIQINRFCSTNTAYYNVLWDNDGAGIALNDSPTTVLYNNTSTANQQGGTNTEKGEFNLLSTATDSTTVTAKNNLGVATAVSAYSIYIDPEVSNNTLDITNNDWWRSSGNWYFFNATPGATLATWNGLAAGIGTDISDDPLFTSGANFDLLASSPCMEAGVAVGLSFDFSGGLIAGLPDCGAYEGPPEVGSLELIGGGHNAKGHLGMPSLGFDTCTVTSLLDTGGSPANGSPACGTNGGVCTGTFRQCMGTRNRPRLINASVGGTITIHACDPDADGGPWAQCQAGTASEILIDQPYLTIDFTTAPSPGITLLQADHGPSPPFGAAQGIMRVKMTHNFILRGFRMQGHFVPYVDQESDETQLFALDGDSGQPECSTWDDLPECPSCTVSPHSCDECGPGDINPPVGGGTDDCNGPRNFILDHITFRNAGDEAGASFCDVDNGTREHIFWYQNYHPSGIICNTQADINNNKSRKFNTDYANVLSQNGERHPKLNKGSFYTDIYQTWVHDWRNYTYPDTGCGGVGIQVQNPLNWYTNGVANTFLPGNDGGRCPAHVCCDGKDLLNPAWDCFEGGDPNAGTSCTAADTDWCNQYWSKNLFYKSHNLTVGGGGHCVSKGLPTAPGSAFTRDYPLPTVLDPNCSGDPNCTVTAPLMQALITQAGMPYPNAEENAVLADVYADWLARAVRCGPTNGQGCQDWTP